MKRSINALVFMILILASRGAVAAADGITVGAVTPLSGELAVYGEGIQNSMLLALGEINAEGGINGRPMQIVFADNNSTAEGSVSAVRKLIADQVPVIFGPAASANFLAVCPIAQQNRTILIAAESAAASISQCGSYVFRVFPSNLLQSKNLAELTRHLQFKEVVLTYIKNDWGIELAHDFKADFLKGGGKLVDEFAHDEGRNDYRNEILRIKKASPQAVVNLTYVEEGAIMLKQAQELDLEVQWLMGSAVKSPALVEHAGAAAEGVIGTYPVFPQDSAPYLAYKNGWEKKYPGRKPPIFGEYNYDMVKLTAEALRQAASLSADDIRSALIRASQGYVGATGDKSFDENGEISAAYGRWTVRKGKIVDYQ